MNVRTQEEIDRQIEGLEKMREELPQTNFFGDDNWEPIDAQLAMLRGEAEYEDYEDERYEVESVANDTKLWMEGDTEDDLFEEE